MRTALQATVGLMLVTGVISCGSPAVQAPRTATDPAAAQALPTVLAGDLFYLPGESMTWDLKFLGMDVGRARFAVGQPGMEDGRHLLAVMGEGEAAGMAKIARSAHDAMTSWIDLETGEPLRSQSELKLNEKHIRVATVRGPGRVAHLEVEKVGQRRTERRKKRLPDGPVHDGLSSLLALRGWSAADGTEATMHTLGGARLWRTTLVVTRHETIDTAIGRRPAIRIDGHSVRLDDRLRPDTGRRRSFTVWLSDDAQRVLLRFKARTEYGPLEMLISAYQTTPTGSNAVGVVSTP